MEPGNCSVKGMLIHMIQAILAAVVLLLVGADQLTKYLAVQHLKGQPAQSLIPHVLNLHYTENEGAAFGILKDHRWIFITVTILVMLALVYLIIRQTYSHPVMNASFTLIVAGGVGNLIDRIALGYVVDFLDFDFMNFAIFNLADVFVVCGSILLVVYVLFLHEKPKPESGDTQDGTDGTDSGER